MNKISSVAEVDADQSQQPDYKVYRWLSDPSKLPHPNDLVDSVDRPDLWGRVSITKLSPGDIVWDPAYGLTSVVAVQGACLLGYSLRVICLDR